MAVLAFSVAAFLPAEAHESDPDPRPYVERGDLVDDWPPDMGAPLRIARFIHSTDAHIIDDDAPSPLRVEPIDPLGNPVDGAQRPQEEFTDEALNAMIGMFNVMYAGLPVDFVMNTGDNSDNSLENEVVRFIDNFDGTYTTAGKVTGSVFVPDGQDPDPRSDTNAVTDRPTGLPIEFQSSGYNIPLVSDIPWFVTFGNHDGLIQGNMPIEPGFNDLAAQYGRHFVSQAEYIDLMFGGDYCTEGLDTADADDGHGFHYAGDRLCDADPDNDGYYSYDWGPIHYIVLDTINDDWVYANAHNGGTYPGHGVGPMVGGYAEGALDPLQYSWLVGELDANQDRPVIIFAHHTVNSFWTPGGSSSDSGYVSGDELVTALNGHDNIFGLVGGHTHMHRIQPKGTFWNVETASIVDPPHENRVIEVLVAPNGTALLKSFVFQTPLPEFVALGAQDPQIDAVATAGTPLDRDVKLWFKVPERVLAPLAAKLDRTLGMFVLPDEENEPIAGREHTFTILATTGFTDGAPPATTVYNVTHRLGTGETIARFDIPANGTETTFTIDLTQTGAHVVIVKASGPDVENATASGRLFVTKSVTEEISREPLDKKEDSPLGLLVVVAAVGCALAFIVRRRR